MGEVYASDLKRAGNYVLKLLAEKASIRYAENFYDGTDELTKRLREEMGFTDEDAEDTTYPPILVDWAVGQFEKKCLVETEQLPDEMIDGEKDYRITLTEKGAEFLASGEEFQYRDMYL